MSRLCRLTLIFLLFLFLCPFASYAKTDEATMLQQAREQYSEGNYFFASTWLERILKEYPVTAQREEVLLMLSKAFALTGRDEKAANTLRTLLKDYPKAALSLDSVLLKMVEPSPAEKAAAAKAAEAKAAEVKAAEAKAAEARAMEAKAAEAKAAKAKADAAKAAETAEAKAAELKAAEVKAAQVRAAQASAAELNAARVKAFVEKLAKQKAAWEKADQAVVEARAAEAKAAEAKTAEEFAAETRLAEEKAAAAREAETKAVAARAAEAKAAFEREAEARAAEMRAADAKAAEAWAAEARAARAREAEAKAKEREAEAREAQAREAEQKATEQSTTEPKGAEPKGAEPKGAEPKGAEPKGAELKVEPSVLQSVAEPSVSPAALAKSPAAPAELAVPVAMPGPAEPAETVTYTLQVGSFVTPQAMTEVKRKLKNAGLEPVVEQDAKMKQPMIRLSLGEYPSQVEARKQLDKLRAAKVEGFFLKEGDQKYHVYAGSYSNEQGAAKERQRLAALGIKLSLKRVVVSVATFRLTAGTFPTRAAASAKALELEKLGVNAVVTARASAGLPKAE